MFFFFYFVFVIFFLFFIFFSVSSPFFFFSSLFFFSFFSSSSFFIDATPDPIEKAAKEAEKMIVDGEKIQKTSDKDSKALEVVDLEIIISENKLQEASDVSCCSFLQ